MNLLKKRAFLMLAICLLFSNQLSSLPFKNVSSWIFNTKEESFYQEFALENTPTIVIKQTNGSINIKTWNQQKVVVEALKSTKEKDLTKCSVDASLTEQTIKITSAFKDGISGSIDYTLIVPAKSNVAIEADEGEITLKGVEGSINIVLQSGSIDVRNAQSAIYAKNNHGSIHVSTKKLIEPDMISLEAQNSITLALPIHINAQLQAKALQGTVESEHVVTIKPFKSKLNQQAWDQFKKEVFGTLANGGPKIKLYAHTGSIKLIECT